MAQDGPESSGMTDNTERAIGRLEGKLDSLIDSVARQGEASAESRKDMYRKLEDVGRKLDKVDGRVTQAEEKITKVRETTDFVEKAKQQAIGIATVVSLVFMLLGAALSAAGQKLVGYLWGHG